MKPKHVQSIFQIANELYLHLLQGGKLLPNSNFVDKEKRKGEREEEKEEGISIRNQVETNV